MLCMHYTSKRFYYYFFLRSNVTYFLNFQVLNFAQNSDILKQRKNVGYHVVYKEGVNIQT